MKERRPNPNQLIFISKEASVWSLEPANGKAACDAPTPCAAPSHSGGMSSGTTNMPAVYSIWK
jgi:hypothetical protein